MRQDSTSDGTSGRTGRPSRRRFLQLTGAAGAAGLAGCVNSLGGGGNDLADTLVIQMEGGSMLEALKSEAFGPFEEEFGASVEVSLRSSQQNGYAKIKAGQAEADMTSVPPFTLYNGTKEGLWSPISTDEIPNYESNVLDPLKNPVFDPGQEVHGIPHAYGTVGMAYNKNELDSPSSWSVTWDGSYEGHVAMEGFGFIRVFTTALEMGMDPNEIGANGSYEENIGKIWDRVAEQQDLVVTNWTSGDEQARLFASEDAWVGEAWGNVIYGAVQEGNDHLGYTIPEEGAYGYTQNHAILNDISETRRKTALEFINFLLRDDILQPVTEKLGLPPATSVTSDEIENLYDYDPRGGKGLKFPDVAYINEHNDEWSQRWEEIRGN
ncbi:PotD/PotF family extracellular solute-binding protein [Salinirubellus salinus]|uniref:PotD/PotF family extracellular solute-binding protein n=1 Tax=Salinirubellus salinus TaxID=1364945 RepID=A0A9E7R0G6_9EURY|nr:PotD/PotF family extracellular solute-binding protein [Salinirubellus salinus]UWM53367.1 PotD/PotF family extracellular solute-binding protein [Salinirubellus salinus]